MPSSVLDRLFAKTSYDLNTDCWLWQGEITNNGYGRLAVKRPDGKYRSQYAHRLMYEAMVGPIPAGLTLDHLCRVRNCINPAHLEPVSLKENILRGDTIAARNKAKTHCKHGHAFDAENTYVTKEGKRQCRACGTQRQALWMIDREIDRVYDAVPTIHLNHGRIISDRAVA